MNPIPTQIYTIPTPNPIPLHMIPNPESNPDSDSDSSFDSDSGFGIAPGLLTTNVRVNLHGDETASQFAATLLTLGNGQTPADDGLVSIPTTLAEVVKTTDQLKAKVFPNLAQRFGDVEYPQWMCERAILAPKNDVATDINLQHLKELPGKASSYRSIDRACGASHDVDFPAEFLNSLEPPGTLPHNLLLKVGAPIMLLRNLPRICTSWHRTDELPTSYIRRHFNNR